MSKKRSEEKTKKQTKAGTVALTEKDLDQVQAGTNTAAAAGSSFKAKAPPGERIIADSFGFGVEREMKEKG